jgi:hypothetical protein
LICFNRRDKIPDEIPDHEQARTGPFNIWQSVPDAGSATRVADRRMAGAVSCAVPHITRAVNAHREIEVRHLISQSVARGLDVAVATEPSLRFAVGSNGGLPVFFFPLVSGIAWSWEEAMAQTRASVAGHRVTHVGKRRRIGPVIRELEDTDPLFRRVGIHLDG